MIELVIMTGVSGAGKTLAMQAFEEAGYYVTDNIPVAVAEDYFNVISQNEKQYSKVALTIMVPFAHDIYVLAKKHPNFNIKFVGVTASEEALNERYRLTRKLHPGQAKGYSLEECIKKDIAYVKALRDEFDIFIDSTKLNKNEYRNLIYDSCIGSKHKFTVSFFSFGYKISVPQDIETVFDVRLLPNPYWVKELKNLTGKDEAVKRYVLDAPETKEYLKHVIAYLDFYLTELEKNDRNHASIGIACSGGQHRSVAIAEYLADYYSKKFKTTVTHKDLPSK